MVKLTMMMDFNEDYCLSDDVLNDEKRISEDVSRLQETCGEGRVVLDGGFGRKEKKLVKKNLSKLQNE
jgi:hypothetical protein